MNTQRIISRIPCWILAAGLVMSSSAVWAQDKGGPLEDLEGVDRPWAEGVSEENQEKAREIFKDANDLILQQFFKRAAVSYREALKYWDHPAIHYNLSLALMNLDQPLELYESLGKAIEHGVYPLIDESNFKRAEDYRNLLAQQLAHVEIVCDKRNAQVTLDGKEIFVGPGTYKRAALAGQHSLVATKQGYITENKQLVLSPGKHVRIEIRLYTREELLRVKRPFKKWLPWTVAGSGAAVAVLGGILHWRAKTNYEGFDSEFDALFPDNGALETDIPGDLSGRLTRADWQQRIGVTSYLLGGTALATGLVLVFLNQPTTTQVDKPGTEVKESVRDNVSLAPVVGPGTAGITAGFRF